MKENAKKIMIVSIIFGCLLFYVGHRAMLIFDGLEGATVTRLSETIDRVLLAIQTEPINFNVTNRSLVAGGIGFIGSFFTGIYQAFNVKNYRHGEEYGSARWGTRKESEPFKDKKPSNNMILTETESMTMESRPKNLKYARNKNMLLIGGAGTMKTRSIVKPNLMQMHSSYVVTESKNLLPHETGKMFADAGYDVKIFDLVNRVNCDYFNPFAYITTEDHVLMIVKNLLKNTDGQVQKSGDPFWEKAETALYCAIVSFLKEVGSVEEQTFPMVGELLREGRIDDEEGGLMTPLDALFEAFNDEHPNHFASKQYATFKLATPKTASSILICASVRLMPFDIPSIANLVSKDTLELDRLGDKKTILYVCLPDTSETFNFLAAMMFELMFEVLVYRADNVYRGRLPVHVQCILDEFANVGQIPSFDKKVTTIRSREISVIIVLQALSQLKNLFKDTWENITGSCDMFLYLGGMEDSTHKNISEKIGKETIDVLKLSESFGVSGGYSKSHDKTGRELMSADEVGNLDNDLCLLKIRGVPMFKSRKYNLERHRNYKKITDGNPDNWHEFNMTLRPMEAFLEHVESVSMVDLRPLQELTS